MPRYILVVVALLLGALIGAHGASAKAPKDKGDCIFKPAGVTWEECVTFLTQQIKSTTSRGELQSLYGLRRTVYSSLEKYDLALADAKQVQAITAALKKDEMKATIGSTYSELGIAWERTGDLDRAIAAYTQGIAAVRAEPRMPGRYKWMDSTGNQQAMNPNYLYGARGSARFKKGDIDGAIADLSEAIRTHGDPNYPPHGAYHDRGRAYAQKGEVDRALADFNQAIALTRETLLPEYYSSRGTLHEKRGSIDLAVADYQRATTLKCYWCAYWNGRLETRAIELARERLAALTTKPTASPTTPAASASATASSETVQSSADIRRDYELAAQLGGKQAWEAFLAKHGTGFHADLARAQLATITAAIMPAMPQPARPTAEFKRRVALVIGNGSYAVSTKLTNPINDAADMSAALRRLGFDVVEGKNLDRRGMDDAIREFGRKLDRADLALFFYAGHGLQVGGKNYLVPVDAKLERAGDLALDAVDVGVVTAQMEAEKRVNLVFLDACRDNPLSRSLARSLGTRSASVGQGLASIQSAIGTLVAYATQPDNVALDGEGRNSPFTTALLKHIGTPGIEIGTVMRRVRADVIAATREKQVPWDHSSLIGEVVLAR